MIEFLEVGAVNEVDEKHVVIISDCRVYIDMTTRHVMFEFLLDVGEGAEARSDDWNMVMMNLRWDFVLGSGERARDSRGQDLLNLCEAIGIEYQDLKNDEVPMESIIGNEVACSIGEKEIVPVSSMFSADSWEEKIRQFWGFVPVSELSTMPVPD